MRLVKPSTRLVRPGGSGASPPLDRSTTFAYREPRGAYYQRHGHPVGEEAERLLGAVVCRDEGEAKRLRELRTRTGIVAAPDPAWLLLRGLRTLPLRVERQSASALELARRLAEHPRVERVHYPGLGDPRAARWMEGGFGGLLSFDVAGDARAVEQATQVITNATSLGGVESLLETRARWEGDRVPPNLLRLSVGLEDVEDLWADLAQALERG